MSFAERFPRLTGGRDIVRRITDSESAIYLTFDDGPDPQATPKVLTSLRAANAKATFFIVASRAQQNRKLIDQILEEGHSIGNHSLDHTYLPFLQGRAKMAQWIERSEEVLVGMGLKSVGFRPPNGIITPELKWALKQKEIPLILWSQRFFDTRFDWTKAKAEAALQTARAGEIVLLHDKKSVSWLSENPSSLDHYLACGKVAGFEFRALTRQGLAPQI